MSTKVFQSIRTVIMRAELVSELWHLHNMTTLDTLTGKQGRIGRIGKLPYRRTFISKIVIILMNCYLKELHTH